MAAMSLKKLPNTMTINLVHLCLLAMCYAGKVSHIVALQLEGADSLPEGGC